MSQGLGFAQLLEGQAAGLVLVDARRDQFLVARIEMLGQLLDDLGFTRWAETKTRQSRSQVRGP